MEKIIRKEERIHVRRCSITVYLLTLPMEAPKGIFRLHVIGYRTHSSCDQPVHWISQLLLFIVYCCCSRVGLLVFYFKFN